jgi:hypothetical protein
MHLLVQWPAIEFPLATGSSCASPRMPISSSAVLKCPAGFQPGHTHQSQGMAKFMSRKGQVASLE